MCSWKLLLLCQPQLKMIALKWSRARFLLLFFSVLSPRSASFVDCYILLRPIFIFLFLSLDMHTPLCQCWFVVVGARTYIEGKGREALDRTCGLVLCGERENRLLVAWWWITMCEEESGSVLQTAAVTDCKSSGKRELSAAKKSRKCFLFVAGYKNPFPFEEQIKCRFDSALGLFYFIFLPVFWKKTGACCCCCCCGGCWKTGGGACRNGNVVPTPLPGETWLLTGLCCGCGCCCVAWRKKLVNPPKRFGKRSPSWLWPQSNKATNITSPTTCTLKTKNNNISCHSRQVKVHWSKSLLFSSILFSLFTVGENKEEFKWNMTWKAKERERERKMDERLHLKLNRNFSLFLRIWLNSLYFPFLFKSHNHIQLAISLPKYR